MKKNKGFSLIELMIVIAVLAIFSAMPIFNETYKSFKESEERLIEQENIFRFRNQLSSLVQNAQKIDTAFDRQLIMDNFRMIVAKDASYIKLNNKIWNFKYYVISSFERVDKKTVMCNVKNGNNKYRIYLIPGKYSEDADSDDDNGDEEGPESENDNTSDSKELKNE